MGVPFARNVIDPILMPIGGKDVGSRHVNLGERADSERRKELILVQEITQNATKPVSCRYRKKPMNMTILVINRN